MPPRRNRDRRTLSRPIVPDRRANERRDEQIERRTNVRVPIDLWMEEVHGDEVYFRRSCNISEGGVLFDQSIPHPVGTQITLRFQLPGTVHELTTKGEVVAAAHVRDGLGMGVKFTEISKAHLETLRDFIGTSQAKRGTA